MKNPPVFYSTTSQEQNTINLTVSSVSRNIFPSAAVHFSWVVALTDSEISRLFCTRLR